MTDYAARVREAARGSELLRAVASVREDGGLAYALGDCLLRRLYPEEFTRLEAQGNTAEDWSRVRVAHGFDFRRVRGCALYGDVVVGRLAGRVVAAPGLELPSGLYNSTLANCVIGHDALVRDVRLLANYVLGESAAVLDCGEVSCEAGTTFGNGGVVTVGPECGGRGVAAYAELDVELATAVACPAGSRAALADYAAAVEAYRQGATAGRGIIGPRARLRGTPTVRNVYVGAGAVIDGAAVISDSTLLGRGREPARVESGAVVSRSLLQGGSRVATMAVVERSLLAEDARASRHAKVADSILGPNTDVSAGEVTSCLLGPLVACHHQSLLIATLWPGGRGNLAYGANVGSNHTSRAPDQEFWAGEGMFLGLGVNVKFPADFSRSPYTAVACGATLLPQRVAFPFSLIAPPSTHLPGVSPALNEIFPGWMIAENLFALRRCEAKYRARRPALDCRVFRPETVELLRDACRRLEAVRQPSDFYTERDIAGLGKNVLNEPNRRQAIDTYRLALRSYALLGLLEQTRAAADRPGKVDTLLSSPDDDQRWEHQRQLLVGELGVTDVASGLRELPALLEWMARGVERSRAKDDERGRRVIDDYAETHVPADQDALVREAWAEKRRLADEVAEVLCRLGQKTAPEPIRPETVPVVPGYGLSPGWSVCGG
jgi:hypothetical protein